MRATITRRLNGQSGRWAAVLVWAGLIFFVSSQSHLPGPDNPGLDLILEKTAHATEYAVLAILWGRALVGSHRPTLQSTLMALVFAGLYALSDEFHQSFVPGRAADWTDVTADCLGAAIGLWTWLHKDKS